MQSLILFYFTPWWSYWPLYHFPANFWWSQHKHITPSWPLPRPCHFAPRCINNFYLNYLFLCRHFWSLTFSFRVSIHNHIFHALIDSDNIHNFIHPSALKHLHISPTSSDYFPVQVGNGHTWYFTGTIRSLPFTIQNHTFSLIFKSLTFMVATSY